MAIYHLEAKVVSRGAGRSACAASAYLSCSAIYNDYDGVQHDYTRKGGLVWEQIFLPEYAPQEWQDRAILWNAVEENEKTKDSRLAREFVPALPVELTPEQWKELLSDFIQGSFVSEGMCADVAVHDPDPPGHNPHAHILLTVRPLNPDGSWQYKTEKEYLCVRNGEERGFTAAEFKARRRLRAGKSSTRTRSGERKFIWLPRRRRPKAMNAPPSIRKAPNTAGKTRSPNAGTVTSSLSSGARPGQPPSIDLLNDTALTSVWITGAMLPVALTSSPPCMRA